MNASKADQHGRGIGQVSSTVASCQRGHRFKSFHSHFFLRTPASNFSSVSAIGVAQSVECP